jgi:hypothetical protein
VTGPANATVNRSTPVTITARLTTADGQNVVSGYPVRLQASAGSIATSSITVGSGGLITFTYTPPPTRGPVSIEVWDGNSLVNRSLAYRTSFPLNVIAEPYPAPTLNAPNASAYNKVDVTWTDVNDEQNYSVWRSSTGAVGSYSQVSPAINANTTSWADTTVAASTRYYYIVRASNGVGYVESNAQSVITPAAPPPTP